MKYRHLLFASSALLLLAGAARAAPGTVTLQDSTGTTRTFSVDVTAGVYSFLSTPALAGATVSSSNPLPILGPVSQSGTWTITLASGSHVTLDAGSNVIGSVAESGTWNVAVSNFPSSQAITATSLPLPSGAATATLQSSEITAINAVTAAVTSNAISTLPPGTNSIGTVGLNTGSNTIGNVGLNATSGSWTDASNTFTATAATAVTSTGYRYGIHIWNVGSATACMNYTTAAVASTTTTSGCAAGAVPIAGGSAYFEDQPGNVSPEAISIVCTGASCPLTIKVR